MNKYSESHGILGRPFQPPYSHSIVPGGLLVTS
jgi:hypothetical protein